PAYGTWGRSAPTEVASLTVHGHAVRAPCDRGCIEHLYGLPTHDKRATGKSHGAFTLDPSGDYPFFTIPMEDVEWLNLNDPQCGHSASRIPRRSLSRRAAQCRGVPGAKKVPNQKPRTN